MSIEANPRYTDEISLVSIDHSVVQGINAIATKRQTKMGVLINEILENYLFTQSYNNRQDGAAFLLSIAGMFDTGVNDTSENVHAIVADFILEKRENLA